MTGTRGTTSAVAYRIMGARDRLLAVPGGARDSLDNINTAPLPDGSLCWVSSEKEFYVLDKDATTASIFPLVVDNVNIVKPAAQQPAQLTGPTIPNPGLWFRLCFLCALDEPSGYAAFQSFDTEFTDTPGVPITGTSTPGPIVLPVGSLFALQTGANLVSLFGNTNGTLLLDAAMPPATRVRIIARASLSAGTPPTASHVGLSIAIDGTQQPLSEQFVTVPALVQQPSDIVHVTAEVIASLNPGQTVLPNIRIFGASPTAPATLLLHSASISLK